MAIVSSKLTDGQTASVSAVNNLREDLLTNHDHDGTKGAQVDHGDLTESGAMTGRYAQHSDIDVHIAGSGHTLDDDPGYAQGVHGLHASSNGAHGYVVGSFGAQRIILTGSVSVGPTSYDGLLDLDVGEGQVVAYVKKVDLSALSLPDFKTGTVPVVMLTLQSEPNYNDGAAILTLLVGDATHNLISGTRYGAKDAGGFDVVLYCTSDEFSATATVDWVAIGEI